MTSAPCFTLFSDFNCPFCYALHERLHALRLLDRCEWRGVQHAPHLPRPMKPWQGSWAAELRHEVMVVRRLSPDLPIALPSGKPNTGAAIERVAALFRQDRTRGMEFVREAYRAFWREGQDLSDPDVLERLSGSALSSGPDGETLPVVAAWETAWHATGQSGVPLIAAADGSLLVGCVPTEEIIEFFRRFDP